MRVVRFHAPQDVRVEDAPEPTAGPGELLVRVRNCSICGTDAKICAPAIPTCTRPGCSATRSPARWPRSATASAAGLRATGCR
jgi:NADPH:quinone reductase-like Zn-dependent oxidoreductase